MVEHNRYMEELEGTVLWVERKLKHSRPDLRDDLLQEGRKAALESLSTHRPEGKCSRRTWAVKYIRRDMLRLLEKEQESFVDINELLDKDGVEELLDMSTHEYLEASSDVEHMLIWLTDPERLVVINHVFKDESFEKIGERLSFSKQHVNRLWHSAVAKIQQEFM
jgi:RNA polymerase sigma factor (sigma-70 family)